jgi:hypothetical protein
MSEWELRLSDARQRRADFVRNQRAPNRLPQAMMQKLHDRGDIPSRQGRILAIALCKRTWHLLDPVCREIVLTIERWAHGAATEDERAEAERVAAICSQDAQQQTPERLIGLDPAVWAVNAVCLLTAARIDEIRWLACDQSVPEQVEWTVCEAIRCERDREGENPFDPEIDTVSVAMIDDVFGGPAVCSDAIQSSVPAEAIAIAGSMYERDDFGRVGELADLLETQSRTPQLIEHFRGSACHVRGCWAIAAIVGDGSGT